VAVARRAADDHATSEQYQTCDEDSGRTDVADWAQVPAHVWSCPGFVDSAIQTAATAGLERQRSSYCSGLTLSRLLWRRTRL
jgi:hypothetical protein